MNLILISCDFLFCDVVLEQVRRSCHSAEVCVRAETLFNHQRKALTAPVWMSDVTMTVLCIEYI